MRFQLIALCMIEISGCVPEAATDDVTAGDEFAALANYGSSMPPLTEMRQATLPQGSVHANAWSDCLAGFSCYWDAANGGGLPWMPSSAGWWFLNGLRDRISSVWNRGRGAVDLYNCEDQACSVADYMTTVAIGVQRNLGAFENKADIIFIH